MELRVRPTNNISIEFNIWRFLLSKFANDWFDNDEDLYKNTPMGLDWNGWKYVFWSNFKFERNFVCGSQLNLREQLPSTAHRICRIVAKVMSVKLRSLCGGDICRTCSWQGCNFHGNQCIEETQGQAMSIQVANDWLATLHKTYIHISVIDNISWCTHIIALIND